MHSSRGFAWADVTSGSARFRFVTTHLESQSADVALAQARELASGPASASATPTVIVCDCNSDPADDAIRPGDTVARSSTYDLLTGLSFRDKWLEQAGGSGRGFTAAFGELVNDPSAAALTRRLDLVLARDAGKVRIHARGGAITGAETTDRDPRPGCGRRITRVWWCSSNSADGRSPTLDDVLDALSPQRRRLVLIAAGLGLTLLLVGVLTVVVRSVRGFGGAAPQDQPGPVLLVPGYGGNADSLAPLEIALRAAGREVVVVTPAGDGTGDLRAEADHLADVAASTLDRTGAPSVDVIGYSGGRRGGPPLGSRRQREDRGSSGTHPRVTAPRHGRGAARQRARRRLSDRLRAVGPRQ